MRETGKSADRSNGRVERWLPPTETDPTSRQTAFATNDKDLSPRAYLSFRSFVRPLVQSADTHTWWKKSLNKVRNSAGTVVGNTMISLLTHSLNANLNSYVTTNHKETIQNIVVTHSHIHIKLLSKDLFSSWRYHPLVVKAATQLLKTHFLQII